MTNDELAKKLDEKFAGVDEKFAGLDEKFSRVDARFSQIDEFAAKVDKRFESLEQKMDDGFAASKIRDEDLRGLMTFGLEAREVLREEVHRRFDASDRKHDEQITLLKDVIRQAPTKK